MKLYELTTSGLRNLYFAKLRSILALLGILVGTASVVAMVMGGELATNEALKQFKSLGTDLLAVTLNMSMEEYRKNNGKTEELSVDQALSLQSVSPNIIDVAPYTQLFYPSFYEGQSVGGMILGVTDSFANVVHINLLSGRFISMKDLYTFYCVIGKGLYDKLKKISPQEPLGQQLQVGKNIFVIVGVADSWPENNFVYADIDNSILIPILASTALSKYANVNNLIVRLKPETDIEQVKTALTQQLKEDVSGKQVMFRSAKELINKMRKQSDILTLFLGLIGGISLLVGGIGVMNIMLVSVMERRREIGLRMAIGAKRRDIAALFLMEAIVLGLLGGGLGVLVGVVITYLLALAWHWEFTFFILPPLVGFSVSVAVGIFFGFYPAYQASRLRPIDALKTE